MKNRNQNQKNYLIHWGDTYSDDIHTCLEDAKKDIQEAIQDGDERPEDIMVYEISAVYQVAMAEIKLVKSDENS